MMIVQRSRRGLALRERRPSRRSSSIRGDEATLRLEDLGNSQWVDRVLNLPLEKRLGSPRDDEMKRRKRGHRAGSIMWSADVPTKLNHGNRQRGSLPLDKMAKLDRRSRQRLVKHQERHYRKTERNGKEVYVRQRYRNRDGAQEAMLKRWLNFRGRTVASEQINFERHYRIRRTFDIIDEDKSGEVDVHEIRNALKEMDIPLEQKELQEAISCLDQNGDNRFDYNEFVNLLAVSSGKRKNHVQDAAMFKFGLWLNAYQRRKEMARVFMHKALAHDFNEHVQFLRDEFEEYNKGKSNQEKFRVLSKEEGSKMTLQQRWERFQETENARLSRARYKYRKSSTRPERFFRPMKIPALTEISENLITSQQAMKDFGIDPQTGRMDLLFYQEPAVPPPRSLKPISSQGKPRSTWHDILPAAP